MERINSLCSLRNDIIRKIKKIDEGEIEEAFDDEYEHKRRYKKI